jgi:hypothetical protein
LTLLTKILVSQLAGVRAAAISATSPIDWKDRVINPLRVTVWSPSIKARART